MRHATQHRWVNVRRIMYATPRERPVLWFGVELNFDKEDVDFDEEQTRRIRLQHRVGKCAPAIT